MCQQLKAPLEGMEKAPTYLGSVIEGVDAKARSLASDGEASLLRLADLFDLPAPETDPGEAPPAWQLQVTFGLLQQSSIGLKALACSIARCGA